MILPDELVKGCYYEVIYRAPTKSGFNLYLVEAKSDTQVKVHFINGVPSHLEGGINGAKSIRLVSKEYVLFKGDAPTTNKKGASLLLEKE